VRYSHRAGQSPGQGDSQQTVLEPSSLGSLVLAIDGHRPAVFGLLWPNAQTAEGC